MILLFLLLITQKKIVKMEMSPYTLHFMRNLY